jgi:hypothetical protein
MSNFALSSSLNSEAMALQTSSVALGLLPKKMNDRVTGASPLGVLVQF